MGTPRVIWEGRDLPVKSDQEAKPIVPPVARGDGSIFVSIASYRGKKV